MWARIGGSPWSGRVWRSRYLKGVRGTACTVQLVVLLSGALKGWRRWKGHTYHHRMKVHESRRCLDRTCFCVRHYYYFFTPLHNINELSQAWILWMLKWRPAGCVWVQAVLSVVNHPSCEWKVLPRTLHTLWLKNKRDKNGIKYGHEFLRCTSSCSPQVPPHYQLRLGRLTAEKQTSSRNSNDVEA